MRVVKQGLEGVPGVTRVEVSLETGEAQIEGQARVEGLIAAVKDEGYEAQTG